MSSMPYVAQRRINRAVNLCRQQNRYLDDSEPYAYADYCPGARQGEF